MSPLAIKIEEGLTNLGTTEFESRHRILNRDGSISYVSIVPFLASAETTSRIIDSKSWVS
jgi:hypothetical protein